MRFAKLIGMLPVAGMLALGAVSAWAQASGEPIKIGAVVSATGAGAGLSVPERNGILLAEKVINAAGGVKGRPIKVLIEDDASNPDTALSKANERMDAAFYTPVFPRFYSYDVLRGLRFLARWSKRAGAHLGDEEIAEVRAAVEHAFGSGGETATRAPDSGSNIRPDALGVWHKGPVLSFPHLDRAREPALGLSVLRREWEEVRSLLPQPPSAPPQLRH